MSAYEPPPPVSTGEGSLLPMGWSELSPLVDALLDAPPELRAAVLAELSAGDPERRDVLERLVAECERDMPLLDRPAAERFPALVAAEAEVVLPQVLGGRYQVEREVGRGGMARVYLARDLKHARDVAVKVIRPDVAMSLGRERFLDEIGIAARLRHPNIVPLYDSGDADGVLYYVMPFEEGVSLRARLTDGPPLAAAESIGILRDVARALAYAHERGVVHRDVKPDNVLLSGGSAVVTDFGIATAVRAAQGDGETSGKPWGGGIGTPDYMSPEQAAGDPSTDHRTDIYSFGCLAFELLCGSAPFHDQPRARIAFAHATSVPPLVSAARSDVPAPVVDLIARCLEKRPDDRPQSARAVLGALDGASTGIAAAGVGALPSATVLNVLRVGLVLAVVALAVTAYGALRAPKASPPVTLAVLPFRTIGSESTLDFVDQGLSDEVAGALTRVPGILIQSRSGARAYAGRATVDVAEAGRRLNADYVMTGDVRRERGSWILSAEVVRAADGERLWQEAFTLRLDQPVSIAEVIAPRLVQTLQRRFPGTVGTFPALAANQSTSNGEANRLYKLGQMKLDQRSQGVKESADFFRGAIAKDSSYARAYAGLSLALALFPNQQGYAVADIQDELLLAARRAIALDSTLAQPHVALGMAHGFNYQWDSAAAEFQTAIGLDARDVEARIQYARHLRNRGRLAEAIFQLRTARLQDPASAVVLSQLSYAYYVDGQLDSALVESVRALENDPNNRTSLVMGALVRLARKRPGEARTLIDRAPPTSPLIAYVIAMSGDTAAARQRVREQDAMSPQPGLAETQRSYTYLGLGDTARALSALERATDAREIWPVLQSYRDPVHDPIRESPRFKALLRRVGLSP